MAGIWKDESWYAGRSEGHRSESEDRSDGGTDADGVAHGGAVKRAERSVVGRFGR